jgi:hypothetical protein
VERARGNKPLHPRTVARKEGRVRSNKVKMMPLTWEERYNKPCCSGCGMKNVPEAKKRVERERGLRLVSRKDRSDFMLMKHTRAFLTLVG